MASRGPGVVKAAKPNNERPAILDLGSADPIGAPNKADANGERAEAPEPGVVKEYEAAKASAGNSAEGLMALALWCEQKGMLAERAKNLARALDKSPDDARARALLGMVKAGGRWRDAAEAAAEPAPEILAQYHARRAATDANRAQSQWDLALWCERSGLHAEAYAHYAAVVRLDPSRDAAWRKMGYRRHKGRWMTQKQIDAEITSAQVRLKADKHWGPELDRLRTLLRRGEDSAVEAESALAAVSDPLVVPKLWEIFVLKSPRSEEHALAARVLARIDTEEATSRLARLAVADPSKTVMDNAAKWLVTRDPRSALGALIDMLRVPVAFRVVPRAGEVAGELQVEGKAYNVFRLYALHNEYNPLFELNQQAPITRTSTEHMTGYTRSFRQTLIPARAIPNFFAATLEAHAALRRDASMVRKFNQSILAMNERIEAMLRALSGFQVSDDPILKAELARVDAGEPPAGADDSDPRRNAELRRRLINERGAATDSTVLAQAAAMAVSGVDPLDVDKTRITWEEARLEPKRVNARNDAWRRWWGNERGYSPGETKPPDFKPTVLQVRTFDVPVAIIPAQYSESVTITPPHHSCFAAGTLVHTQTGERPIEEIQPGDLVLSEDTIAGALGYHVVTAIHHRKPTATLCIVIGREKVIVTGIHRFWKAGTGWMMARDLEAGDMIRTVHGVRTVESVAPDQTRPVFNLDVEGPQDFFVGESGLLVHDDSVPEPVAKPFDAVAAAGVAAVK